MAYEKEMTALNPSVAADEEQSNNDYGNSITDYDEKSNSFEANNENDFDYQNLDFDEEYVDTITMNELYNSVYSLKPPIVEGLLNSGVYLFVGAPKLGKSFLMAQLAYHVSTGIPLWKLPSCISHWKMITADSKGECTRCSERKRQTIFTSQ